MGSLRPVLYLIIISFIIGAAFASSNEALKNFIRARLRSYKAEVEQVHGLIEDSFTIESNDTDVGGPSSSSRYKRTIIKPFSTQPGRRRRNATDFDFGGTNVVTKTFQLTSHGFGEKSLYDLNIIQINSEFHAFTLEKSTTAQEVETVVYKFQNLNNIQEIARIATPGATSIEVTRINSEYYVFPVKPGQQTGDHGSHLWHFDVTSHDFRKVQTIQTPNVKFSHFWKGSGQEANDVFLALPPDHMITSAGHSQYKVQIPVHMWQGGYFDKVYSITAYNPQSIQYTSIASHEYLAVANYQDSPKSTTIFSEIHRYSYKASRFVLFQRVLTHGAKDMKFFSFDNGQRGENFLVIANQCEYNEFGTVNFNVKSQILKLASERFIPFQSIATNGAFQILPVKSGSLFMLVVGEIKQFRIVQYNGFRFVETFRKAFSESNKLPDFIRLRSLVFDTHPFYAVASSDISQVQSGIFGFEFEEKNHMSSMRKDFYTWCTAAVAKVEAANVPTLKEEFELAPKTTDKEIVLKSDITFHHLQSEIFHAQSLAHDGRTFDAVLSRQLLETEQTLKAVDERILDIEIKLGQVLTKNSKQDVSTEVHFANVEHRGSRIQSVDVVTQRLNKFDVEKLLTELVFLAQDYSFKSLTAGDITARDAEFFKHLNGHPFADYARRTSNSMQKFQQDNTFLAEARIQKGIKVEDLFGGVNFHDITFLTSNGNQTFSSPIHIGNSQVSNLYSSNVNGVDLGFYMGEAVKKKGDAIITGVKEFQSASIRRLQAKKISGIDVDKLYSESIYLDSERITQDFIGSTVNFDELVTKNLAVSSSLLNNKYNIDELVTIHQGLYNFDSIELLQDTTIHNLEISSFLNSIRVTEDGLNVVLKNSDKTQVISKKDYSQIYLERDATADDEINGINFAEWSAEKKIKLKSNMLSFRNLQIDGDMTITPGISFETGRSSKFLFQSNDVIRLLSKALLLNETRLPSNFRGIIKFNSVDVDGDTQITTINRASPSDWLTRKLLSDSTSNIKIRGEKTFTEKLELLSPSTTSELFSSKERAARNVLTQLNDFLLDGVDQNIARTTKFKERVTIDNLDCPRVSLNGILFKDLLLVQGDQKVAGKAIFEKEVQVRNEFQVIKNMDVKKVMIDGEFHSLNELISDALLIASAKPQIVTGIYEFNAGFTTESLTTLDDISGTSISTLLEGIIRKDAAGPQSIRGSLTFGKETDIERIEFVGKLQSKSHKLWGEDLMLTTGHQIITRPVKFLSGLQASTVEVNDEKVSNIRIGNLAEDVLRVDDYGSLGFVDFTGTVEAMNGVNMDSESSTVNDFNILKDLLLNGKQYGHQIVTETKTFEKPIKIQGNLNVKDLHGFDYEQAVIFVNPTSSSTQENLHIIGDLSVEHEPNFTSHINGISWETILQDIWWIHKPTTITSNHKFSELIFTDTVVHTGNLGDFDLEELDRTYLSKTKDQVIDATDVVFESGVTIKDLGVRTIEMPNGGLFNRVNLKEFSESVFLNGVDQIIPHKLEFEELHVDKIELPEDIRVGDLDLSSEALTINGENVVIGLKTVESLTAQELKLDEFTKLAGIDVHEWNKKAVTSHGDHIIQGDVRIDSATFLLDISALKTVDNREFNRENIFTLSGDQAITGKITFINQVLVSHEGIETESFNGQNLAEVVDTFVLADAQDSSPIIIKGEKTFTRTLHAESIRSESLVLNENLTEVIEYLKPETHIDVITLMETTLDTDYDQLIEKTTELISLSEKQAVFLDYYEFTHKIPVENIVNFKPLTLHGEKTMGLGIVAKSARSVLASATHSFSFMIHKASTNSYTSWELSSVNAEGIINDFAEVHIGHDYFAVLSTSSSAQPVTLDIESEEETGAVQSSVDEFSKTVVLQLKEEADGSKKWVIRQSFTGHRFGPTSSFKITTLHGQTNCFMVVDYGLETSDEHAEAFIYSFETDTSSTHPVTLLQKIPIERPSEIASVELGPTTLLLIGSKGDEHLRGHGEVVHAWLYNSNANAFKEIDCLPIVNLVSMSTVTGPNDNTFIALASGQVNEHSGSVYIYKFMQSTQKFVKVLFIPVNQPKQVQFQLIYSEAFLYILNSAPVHNINVYSFKGKMGWVNEHRFTSSNAQILRVSGYKFGNDLTSEVLVAGKNDIRVFTGVFHGNKKNYIRLSTEEEKPPQRRKRFLGSKLVQNTTAMNYTASNGPSLSKFSLAHRHFSFLLLLAYIY